MLAATIVVETIVSEVGNAPLDRAALEDLVEVANEAVVDAQRRSSSFTAMRTTLALLHLDEKSAYWLHCGDTRLYAIRNRRVLARTLDHTVAQMMSDDNESLGEVTKADRHRLLRSLGGISSEATPRIVREPLEIKSGDRFLLCSDGWWEALDLCRLVDGRVENIELWLDNIRNEEVETSNGRDNASAIAVEVMG